MIISTNFIVPHSAGTLYIKMMRKEEISIKQSWSDLLNLTRTADLNLTYSDLSTF